MIKPSTKTTLSTRTHTAMFPPVKTFNLGNIRSAATKTATPMIDTLKKNKKNLTDEERATVMKAKAIWHHGPNGEPSPAVWKSEVDGETWFVTNTHRAFQATKTLDSAIKAFHDVIKKTASKGDPTGTNLYVLKQYFDQAEEIPNGTIKPVDIPHMRRCLQTGLIEIVGGRTGVLRLTDKGRQAIRGTDAVACDTRPTRRASGKGCLAPLMKKSALSNDEIEQQLKGIHNAPQSKPTDVPNTYEYIPPPNGDRTTIMTHLAEAQDEFFVDHGYLPEGTIHFDYQGADIHNPFLEPTGRTDVYPVPYYGDAFMNSEFMTRPVEDMIRIINRLRNRAPLGWLPG